MINALITKVEKILVDNDDVNTGEGKPLESLRDDTPRYLVNSVK